MTEDDEMDEFLDVAGTDMPDAMIIYRRVLPSVIADEIIGVSPMQPPTDAVRALRALLS
jgi:hypothetical protein